MSPNPPSSKQASPLDSTKRFSDRVEFFLRTRPGYSQAVVETLAEDGDLLPEHTVADMGCGTGFLAETFLRHGCEVTGIEPNRNMRVACTALLADYPRFRCLDARGDSTNLPDASVDWISAGQAFPWFDAEACRPEFHRILRPGGRILFAWNDRESEGSPFMQAFDKLLTTHAPDYKTVGNKHFDARDFERFFKDEPKTRSLSIAKAFDRADIHERVFASSYAPSPDHPNHAAITAALDALFDAHAEAGRVNFLYLTRMVWGPLE